MVIPFPAPSRSRPVKAVTVVLAFVAKSISIKVARTAVTAVKVAMLSLKHPKTLIH